MLQAINKAKVQVNLILRYTLLENQTPLCNYDTILNKRVLAYRVATAGEGSDNKDEAITS